MMFLSSTPDVICVTLAILGGKKWVSVLIYHYYILTKSRFSFLIVV